MFMEIKGRGLQYIQIKLYKQPVDIIINVSFYKTKQNWDNYLQFNFWYYKL